MIRIDFSQLHQAREDAAAAMPSIAGKKILMGFWHNWPAPPTATSRARSPTSRWKTCRASTTWSPWPS